MNTLYYKLARPDGWDFQTGKTVNYREALHNGGIVRHPNPKPELGLCSSGVLHASRNINDCFQVAKIPCSVYRVEGTPIVPDDGSKAGFAELRVLEELDPAKAFKWRYEQACNPLHPLTGGKIVPTEKDIDVLRLWDSVWASVGASVRASVGASVGARVRASVWDSVRASVWDSVGASVRASVGASVGARVRASVWDSAWDSMRASVRASVGASVWAYYGWIFAPVVTDWKYMKHRRRQYPFMSAVRLWRRGLVPSYDGKVWRLHSGEEAKIVWSGTV